MKALSSIAKPCMSRESRDADARAHAGHGAFPYRLLANDATA
ncbi:hypothetical protein ACYX7E_04665 [Luteimonas sp. RIT-PG2_3]